MHPPPLPAINVWPNAMAPTLPLGGKNFFAAYWTHSRGTICHIRDGSSSVIMLGCQGWELETLLAALHFCLFWSEPGSSIRSCTCHLPKKVGMSPWAWNKILKPTLFDQRLLSHIFLMPTLNCQPDWISAFFLLATYSQKATKI